MKLLQKVITSFLLGIFVFTMSAHATVGNRYNISSASYLPLTIRSDAKYIKFWINCELGKQTYVYIADKNGNIVSGGERKVVPNGKSATFYVIRPDNCDGYLQAYIATESNSEKSYGWYSYAQYESLREAGDEAKYWNDTTSQNAIPSDYTFYLNNKPVNISAYNIDGNNYVKLRDIAYILNGTQKQFNVIWNNNAIYLQSGSNYVSVGNELAGLTNGNQTAIKTTSTIYKDSNAISYNGYFINGNNFYKLRDIAESFNFEVLYNVVNNRIDINPNHTYSGY